MNRWAGPPPPRPKTQHEIEEDDARYRRSNRGGDDLFTKVLFFVLVFGGLAWIAGCAVTTLRHAS
ncbi:MAG TPA: hypothetical protein VHT53_07245 [Candidatus Elarobacter sp.]|jgi:hypothetical protein|nr:hypothetical protein [Candidatus Elarobacter sp.]